MAAPVQAADFYVDVVNGNDANIGTSPTSAWKTITRASQLAPAGSGTTIHVAPGSYKPSTGEVLPLHFAQQVLLGDQGLASTVLDAEFAPFLIQMDSSTSLTRLEGFTLQSTGHPIDISVSTGAFAMSIAGCRITALDRGIRLAVSGGSASLVVRDSTISASTIGIDLPTGTSGVSVTIDRCTFSNCGLAGVEITTQTTATLSIAHSRLEHDGYAVVANARGFGQLFVTVDDSLIAHSGVNGFQGDASLGGGPQVRAAFHRCTVADNAGTGVQVLGSGSNYVADVSLQSSVLHGNGTDLAATTISTNVFSQVGGPDPQFVDRLNGDYRLRFGSPCVDMGDPATVSGTLDLGDVARPIDGDLDTSERADIGALEFQPLRLVTSGHLGMPVRLEMAGQTGGTTTVYFARSMPVPPMSTPFGEFDLNPAAYGTLLHSNVAPFPPIAFQRPIPNNAFLVGHTFSFQALTTSSVAPQGSAYTNVVSFIVLP